MATNENEQETAPDPHITTVRRRRALSQENHHQPRDHYMDKIKLPRSGQNSHSPTRNTYEAAWQLRSRGHGLYRPRFDPSPTPHEPDSTDLVPPDFEDELQEALERGFALVPVWPESAWHTKKPARGMPLRSVAEALAVMVEGSIPPNIELVVPPGFVILEPMSPRARVALESYRPTTTLRDGQKIYRAPSGREVDADFLWRRGIDVSETTVFLQPFRPDGTGAGLVGEPAAADVPPGFLRARKVVAS